jgi:hypothetical protein
MNYRKTDRTQPEHSPAIAEPVEIASFWKNRKGDFIRVSLQSWEQHNICDVRQFFTGRDGRVQPTKRGITVAVRRIPELLAAVAKAHRKAIELGLLDEEPAR